MEQDRATERRHLTVLFSDLVGSTEIAGRLDPEDWREMVQLYERAAGEAVARFGGKIAHHWGDGLLAYFGYPHAHENDPERAVRAGLAIHEGLAPLNRRFSSEKRPTLAARVGIHTGFVVVGEGAANRADVFGDVPNVAARVQSAALPDTVFITADVHRLVSGLFLVEECGPKELKGVARPTDLYRVVQPTGLLRRVRVDVGRMTRFVGRETELRKLEQSWQKARQGKREAILVVGEAGLGKSRLVQEFHETIKECPHTWIECEGDPLAQNTPLHPVVQVLRQGLGLLHHQSLEQQLETLERSFRLVGLEARQAMPLVAPFLGINVVGRYEPPLADAPEQRRRLLTVLSAWVVGLARAQPLVVVVEDLHWVDPSTIELITLLVEDANSTATLLVCTARPGFNASWSNDTFSSITLSRLTDPEAFSMVRFGTTAGIVSSESADAIVSRASGVPLFVEELMQLVLEGNRGLLQHGIPVALYDPLTARIDALGSAKEIAELGAVIGREFSYELISAISGWAEGELTTALAKLCELGLLYGRGDPPAAVYTFRHALIRDAAYALLLKSRRRTLHGNVAKTLMRSASFTAESPELLAHHYAEAGDLDQASEFWRKAGDRAANRGALVEAGEFYKQSIAALGAAADLSAMPQRELTLQLALAQVLISTRGYLAPETEEVIARARSLCDRFDDSDQPVLVLLGLGAAALQRGELAVARTLFDEATTAAERAHDRATLCWAAFALGVVHFNRGELSKATELYSRSIGLYDEQQHAHLPMDPKVEALSQASLADWHMGFAGRASERIEVAVSLADRINKPFEIGGSRHFAASLCLLLGDHLRAKEMSDAAIATTVQHQLPLYHDTARIVRGRALVEEGHFDEGIALIREGLVSYRDAGNRLALPGFLGILAEGQAAAGNLEAALATVGEALAAQHEVRIEHPNLLRLRGELLARTGAEQLAERDFNEAIVFSREIGSKAYELRNCTSLAGLLAKQGQREQALAILSNVYSSFVEGFDTRDLREAEALMGELARPE